MSITQEQMKNIILNLSKLPHLDSKLEWDVKNIINYMEILNEVDTTWVKPTVSVSNFNNVLRKDVEKRFTQPQEVLACSPQWVVGNCIAVNNIMH